VLIAASGIFIGYFFETPGRPVAGERRRATLQPCGSGTKRGRNIDLNKFFELIASAS
jgi:hypothetical protein